MKKITLFIALMITFIGYSQELPFDFEDGVNPFTSNASIPTIVADPDNSAEKVLQIDGQAGTYDNILCTLALNVDLSDDNNNTITFRIKASNGTGSGSHLLKFEGGSGGPAETQLTFSTTGTDWQNISLNFPAGLGNFSKIVIMTDFDNNLQDVYLLDDFAGGTNYTPPADPAPTDAPTPPDARDAADVVSLYGDAYGTAAGFTGVSWDNGSDASEVSIASNNVLKINNGTGDFIGLDVNNGGTGFVDASDMTKFHTDIWIPAPYVVGQVLNITISNHAGAIGTQTSYIPVNTIINAGEEGTWLSIEGDLGSNARNRVAQIVINYANSQGGLSVAYVDNMYFYKQGDSNEIAGPPATPTFNSASDFISIFSNTADDVAGTNTNGFGGGTLEEISLTGGNKVKKLSGPAGAGFQFVTSPQDLSTGFTHIFFHMYVAGSVDAGEIVNINIQGAGANLFTSLDPGTLGTDQWVTVNMMLADFNNPSDPVTGITNLQFSAAGGDGFGPIYIDNVLFYKAGTAGTDDFNAVQLSAYPNPSNTNWNIKTSNSVITSVEVFNLLGKRVVSLKNNSTDVAISTEGLTSGIYLARVTTDLGTKSIKLIKN